MDDFGGTPISGNHHKWYYKMKPDRMSLSRVWWCFIAFGMLLVPNVLLSISLYFQAKNREIIVAALLRTNLSSAMEDRTYGILEMLSLQGQQNVQVQRPCSNCRKAFATFFFRILSRLWTIVDILMCLVGLFDLKMGLKHTQTHICTYIYIYMYIYMCIYIYIIYIYYTPILPTWSHGDHQLRWPPRQWMPSEVSQQWLPVSMRCSMAGVEWCLHIPL